MDPVLARENKEITGLPRLRGDGPKTKAKSNAKLQVAPPTRGWTQDVDFALYAPTGCPAYAGMDRTRSRCGCARRWLPRLRGDGPFALTRQSLEAMVAPPTRGWTQDKSKIGHSVPGCPAYAGMDPPTGGRFDPFGRLPRLRGDGPRESQICSRARAVAPPTRGWTPIGARPATAT